MAKLIIASIIFLIISGSQIEKGNKNISTEKPNKISCQERNKIENALKFINEYVANSNKIGDRIYIIDWVNSNNLTTKSFKAELKRIIENAYKTEPKVGLNFDPVLDAQDYPKNGFELEAFDEKTNYLIIRGKDWQEFKLTMKITLVNEHWLVDGCGLINIPETKKAKR